MKIIVMALAAFTLLGCEQEPQAKRPIVWKAAPFQSWGTGVVKQYAEAGRVGEAPFVGAVVDQGTQQKEGATYEQVTVESRAGRMLVEADLFALLVKGGYSRRVVSEGAGVFVVEYIKSGDVTIHGAFHELPGKADAARSRVVLSWKIAG
ncbi:hypothetical protein HW090_15370 [Pseudomonas sp. ABC1]|uniref:hypothetical protein n=1 Tax=Pseudomonas sp. ABC1 TaxID=2748080 RepID=UPI0015C3339D|nr:hypothetical protein [Pseudomonas sp. ABC1]QLF94499.1 hypothetical protein HW090_15370 [Pseudomonas sp. ABC1]